MAFSAREKQTEYIEMLASQGDRERAMLQKYAERNPDIAEDVAQALRETKPGPAIQTKRRSNFPRSVDIHPGLAALAMRTGHLQGFRVWAIGREAAGGRGWLTRRELGEVLQRFGIGSEMARRGLHNGQGVFFTRGKGRVYFAGPQKAYAALWDGQGFPTLGSYIAAIDAKAWGSLPALKRALFLGGLATETHLSQEKLSAHWGVSLAQISRWTYRRRDVVRQTNFEVATNKVPNHWQGRNYWEPRAGLFVRRLPNTYIAPAQQARVQRCRLRKLNREIRGGLVSSAPSAGRGERLPGLLDRVFFPSVTAATRWKKRHGLSPAAVIAKLSGGLEVVARQHILGGSARLWQAATG